MTEPPASVPTPPVPARPGQGGLREHQVEAVDAAVRALELPAGAPVPEGGLRAQVVAACGTGKTRISAGVAQALRAGRVLVLVPTLDLLVQSAAAWRAAGRTGPVVGVCSLGVTVETVGLGLRCTTSAPQLALWVGRRRRVVVFATYASLPTVCDAHGGVFGLEPLPGWDLVVVDEAHRTAGRWGKAWADVHDNARIPAARRLYLTATPRIWEAGAGVPGSGEEAETAGAEPDRSAQAREEAGAGAGGGEAVRLVASMHDERVFGPVAYRLTTAQAVDRGLLARYRVLCLEIRDPQVAPSMLRSPEGFAEAVRGARLEALRSAVLTAMAEHGLARVLTYHHRTAEARAFVEGLPEAAAALHRAAPDRHPQQVWSGWLHGEHDLAYRREVLERFAAGRTGDGTCACRAVLASCRVLAEGVDVPEVDTVVFADPKGSTVDVVQAVGRALRMCPGGDKVATLVVPVFLGPDAGDGDGDLLDSPGYEPLVKVLTALRAHDTEGVERLGLPSAAADGAAAQAEAVPVPRTKAADGGVGRLLQFSRARDAAAVAAFVRLRVLEPEGVLWRRGLASARAYRARHRHLRVPFTYRDERGFPLGQWIASRRSEYAAGALAPERITELERLGMVWSHHDLLFAEGLDACRAWAALHGHLAAPADAVIDGYQVGQFLKRARAAARAGTLPAERHKALEEIDPAWNPAWPVEWQRRFHLLRRHVLAGGSIEDLAPGRTVDGGVDLHTWVLRQRARWEQLSAVQQWLLTDLGVQPLPEEAKKPRRSHGDAFAANLAAARRFFEREGHLNVPRKHVEILDSTRGNADGADGQGRAVRLGVWLSNIRARRTKLAPERIAALEELGIRWSN